MGTRTSIIAGFAGASLLACLPASFDHFAEVAPVTTVGVQFPGQPSARIAVALTVEADDEGRGRVLFSDGDAAIGWYQIDERSGTQRFASFEELTQLATYEQPTLTGLAVVEGALVAEALVRVAAGEDSPDRVVRVRIADFTRPSEPALDMVVYPWIADPSPTLTGPLAVVQLDDGLPEALSGSSEGLIIWDALGTRAGDYAQARELLLGDDPAAFDDDPSQAYGLTRCPDLNPSAIAGGRLLADRRRAAVVLHGASLSFVGVGVGAGVEQASSQSAVGAPIYACELATLELPGQASVLAVVDLESDGDDDLLVGAPASDEVWVFENHGDGLANPPTMMLASDEPGGFGSSIARVQLGGEAPDVIVVGAPMTRVDGKANVGRVYVYDARDGELLRTITDLEPRTDSRHGLGVHGLDIPGREELVVSGARELRIHWTTLANDPGP